MAVMLTCLWCGSEFDEPEFFPREVICPECHCNMITLLECKLDNDGNEIFDYNSVKVIKGGHPDKRME